jgi:GNAT superfamily N-acetyltransferase
MIAIRRVKEDELATALALHNRFTAQDRSMATVRSWYDVVPHLFLFAVDGDDVIGVCTGRPQGEREVSLAGIGVESNRRGEGIGTRLVEQFEKNARQGNSNRISVASAGGRVDDFYVDNGFEPEKILVMDPTGGPGDHDGTDFDIEWDNGSGKCYVDVTERDPAVLETVRDEFDDDHAIYVMVRELPDR